jgi:protein-arginine kinase activator protein McsA
LNKCLGKKILGDNKGKNKENYPKCHKCGATMHMLITPGSKSYGSFRCPECLAYFNPKTGERR